jgi:hypothetical protein
MSKTLVKLLVNGDPPGQLSDKKTKLQKGMLRPVVEEKTIDTDNYYGVDSKRGVVWFTDSEVEVFRRGE